MIDMIYILDTNKKVVLTLNNESFYDYEYHTYLSTGADTFDFTVKDDKDKIKTKYFVLFFRANKPRIFQIDKISELEVMGDTVKQVESNTVALELYNSQVRPCRLEGNPKSIFSTILQDTNYKLGYVSPSTDNNIQAIVVNETTDVYVLIQDAIKLFNIEIDFRYEVVNSQEGKYEMLIDIYNDGEKGNKTYKRFETDINVYGLARKQDSTEFCSGIIPIGKGGITIKDVYWDINRGDPLNKPKGQDVLLDPEAHNMFANGNKYIIKTMEFDADNPFDLCRRAYEKLQEIKKIKFDYEVPVTLTSEEYENISIGDTVYVLSTKFNPPIQLEARISELILKENDSSLVLSNYKEISTKIKDDITKNDIIKDIEDILAKGSGKLTAADIEILTEYLRNLGLKEEEIDRILAKYKEHLEEDDDVVIEGSENDLEDYSVISLVNTDGGLWLGDDRLYEVKKKGLNQIGTIIGGGGSQGGGSEGGSGNKKRVGTVIIADALNIRSGPGTTYKVVGVMKRGDKCDILGTDSKTGWYNIKYKSITGYASNKYIVVESIQDGGSGGTGGGSQGGGVIEPSDTSKEYQEAYNYYKKFDLGKNGNGSSIDKLLSSSNQYKIFHLVKYWANKFGLDPYLVIAMVQAESGGNPYAATQSSRGGYGLMQCERAAYFNRSATIKFLDGSTRSFTPSYSTMNPKNGMTISINGQNVNQNISNQIMFGCSEFRKSIERFHYNIFAALMGYNFGLYGADLVVCKYVAEKNGLPWVNKFGYTAQSAKVQELYFKELENMQAQWANVRNWYVDTKHMGTRNNIELYLRWYRITDGQLPYTLNKNRVKVGYGANKTSSSRSITNTFVADKTRTNSKVATSIRNKIVAKAREIAELHQVHKKATYSQWNRTYDDEHRHYASGWLNGIYKPALYDCSSLASCSYKCVGLTSIYNKSCAAGTLVSSATSKSGWKAWKCTTSNLDNYALPGDVIMVANSSVSDSTVQKNPRAYTTHHVVVYCGKVNGKHMISHASKPASPPNSIRYEKADYYINGGKSFILRPWDLAKKDSEAIEVHPGGGSSGDSGGGSGDGEVIVPGGGDDAPTIEILYELDIKALPKIIPNDFSYNGKLVDKLVVNGLEDDYKYPSKLNYVFVNASMNKYDADEYINLLNIVLAKYPNTPVFVTQEFGSSSEVIEFNDQIKKYANLTKYLIYLTVPSTITTNAITSSNASLYYNEWKKAILLQLREKKNSNSNKPPIDGGSDSDGSDGNDGNDDVKPNPPTPNPPKSIKVEIAMEWQKIHQYKDLIHELYLKLPIAIKSNYWSKIIFTTSTTIKFKQSVMLYAIGDHCKSGNVVLKPNTSYSIIVFVNPDLQQYNHEKYLASVTAITNGKYEIEDRKKFKGANDVVAFCKTYLDEKSIFQYSTSTPLNYSNNMVGYISKWKVNGKFNIDCSTLTKLIYAGHNFGSSPYYKTTTRLFQRNSRYSWTFTLPRTAGDQAKYCVENGWVCSDITQANLEETPAGALVFYDGDGSTADRRYLGIYDVAICLGKDSDGVNWVFVVSESGTVFQKIKINEHKANKVVLVCYPKKY